MPSVRNTTSQNLKDYQKKMFRDVVNLVDTAITDTQMDAMATLRYDPNYEVDPRFIKVSKAFRDRGLTGEVSVDGAKAEGGNGNDMAAYIEFGTGLSAREILAPYPQWVKDIAMKFYVNGLGTLVGKPYLYNNFLRHEATFRKNLKELIEKQVTDND